MENNNRYCVIMCGGIGSRFWPFSRTSRPKQFLDFFGSGRSLLQMTFDRISHLVPKENIILVTNIQYRDLVIEQLPEIPQENVLCEPARRNTAPCILWAARHIKARNPEASMVILPSDHLILREIVFLDALRKGFEFIEAGDRLLTIGIRPSNPNTGYGYIQMGDAVDGHPDFMKVKTFTEKPDLEMARIFIDSGEFLWNAGQFLWTADAILKAFEQHAPDLATLFETSDEVYLNPEQEKRFVESVFPQAVNISIDYAVLEKARNVFVEESDPGWSDVGSWRALYEVSPKNEAGNVTQNCRILANDCHNTLFATGSDKLIAACGLDGYIVVDTDNALLIYPAEREQEIKSVVTDVTALYGDKFV